MNFSGFIAWWLWRGIYWMKLPRTEKKLRVALDWALDVFFAKDFVQYLNERSFAVSATEAAEPVAVRGRCNTLLTQQPKPEAVA
jgi:hypothetical protein